MRKALILIAVLLSFHSYSQGRIKVSTANSDCKTMEIATGNYSISDSVHTVIYTGLSNATITLPNASMNCQRRISISNYAPTDTNINLTIVPPVIVQGGSTNLTMAVLRSKILSSMGSLGHNIGNSVTIISDGTNWYKISN